MINNRFFESVSTKALLSTIWIFASLNYIYCDLIGLMDSVLLKQYLQGTVNGIPITQELLISAAVLVEIPMAMVLLSRILRYRANRWANIVAGSIMTIVQIATLFKGTPTNYYLFCSVVEIAATAFVVWIAWNWKSTEA